MKKFALIFFCLMLCGSVSAKLISREEALRSGYPGSQIQSLMVFLTDAEAKEISRIAGVPVQSKLVARYIATLNGKIAGTAYLDTHIVRTKKESLLILLDPTGKVKRVEVVAFLEPPEYMPQDRWYQQFEGKPLTENLTLKRDIHPVTGATLTARSTTEAVRRALATETVIARRAK